MGLGPARHTKQVAGSKRRCEKVGSEPPSVQHVCNEYLLENRCRVKTDFIATVVGNVMRMTRRTTRHVAIGQ